ncbi:hypothetical protein ABFT80_03460 [Mesorhizobium sp. SB112]|uniref:hypothetical protein n=1 Tax=Mesorhizobium sp. SB112 TaxID=3151853 RepID=UPI0032655B11
MNFRKKRLSFWVALAAAYLLVLQSVTGALALGAQSERAMLDAFGNPLCITSVDQSGTDAGDQAKMPNCCVIGCSMFTQALGTPPDETVQTFHAPIVTEAAANRQPVDHLPAVEHKPGNPRAPPLTA